MPDAARQIVRRTVECRNVALHGVKRELLIIRLQQVLNIVALTECPKYQWQLGDKEIGRRPVDGNVVNVEGDIGNGARYAEVASTEGARGPVRQRFRAVVRQR